MTSKNLTDVNSFENPNHLETASFSGAKKEGEQLVLELPSQSVVMLELK